jgi:glycine C-acetyltransferase/8-amino-7-oxononanoate synthase
MFSKIFLKTKPQDFISGFKQSLEYIDSNKSYPKIHIASSQMLPRTMVDGQERLLFCSNNYLGLSTNQEIISKSIDALKQYGTGAGGSRILSGNLKLHEELEAELAQFKGKEAALVFPSGFQVNSGVIPALINVFSIQENAPVYPGVIFSDSENHASIIDGCKLSRAKVEVYSHCNVDDLQKKIKKYPNNVRKLIVTDGVFSMDGDLAPLDKIVEIKKQNNAFLLLDDAHGTGTMGPTGRGLAEHFNVENEVDLIMGTFSKALGGIGGFVAGNNEVIRYLRLSARTYMFSAGLPAGVTAGILEAVKTIKAHPEIVKKLHENANYLRNGLQKIGYSTLSSQSAIIPLLIGDEEQASFAAEYLFNKGIYALPVRWPAVKRGSAIIRFTVMATHTLEDLNYVIKICENLKLEK